MRVPGAHIRLIGRLALALLPAAGLPPAASGPILSEPAVGSADPRVEVAITGFEGDFPFSPAATGCEADVQVWQATDDPRQGSKSAGISFTVRAGVGSAALRADLPLPGRPDELRVWVRGDACGKGISARVQDASGETHVIPLGRADFAGWRLFAVALRDGGEHTGGDGNARLDYPVRLTQLCVDGLEPGDTGVLYFDTVSATTLLRPEEQLTFTVTPTGPHAVLESSKAPEVLLRARNLLQRPATLSFAWQLTDAGGKKAGSGTGSLALPPAGSGEQKVGLPIKRFGLYRVSVTARCPGLPSHRANLVVALSPSPPPRRSVQDSRLGLNIPGALNDAERSLVRLSGAGWVRLPVRWAEVEKERGRCDPDPALEATVNGLRQAGIRIAAVLQAENPLYPPGEGRIGAWSQWCREMARRWGGRDGVRVWEIGGAGPGSGAAAGPYADLLAAAAAAITRVDEDAVVLAAVPSGAGDGFLDDLIRATGERRVGGFSVASPWRIEGSAPPTASPRITQRVVVPPRAPKPLCLATLDLSAQTAGSGEDALDGAGTLARALLAALVEPRVDAFLLLGLKGGIPGAAGCPNALVRDDLSPTPALLAYRTVAGLCQGVTACTPMAEAFAGGYRLDQGRAALLALWSRVGQASFALETAEAKVTVTDLMGNTRDTPAREGVAVLSLDADPSFVRIPRGGRIAIHPILAPQDALITAHAGRSATTRVRFRSPFAATEPGVLRLSCPAGWHGRIGYPHPAKRGEEQFLEMWITPGPDASPGEYAVELTLDLAPGAGMPARLLLPVRILPAPATK